MVSQAQSEDSGAQVRARQERPADTQLSAPGKPAVSRPRYMLFFQPRLRYFALWQAPGLRLLGGRVHAVHSARRSRLTTMARFGGYKPRLVDITIPNLVDRFGGPPTKRNFAHRWRTWKLPVDSEDRAMRAGVEAHHDVSTTGRVAIAPISQLLPFYDSCAQADAGFQRAEFVAYPRNLSARLVSMICRWPTIVANHFTVA